MKVLFDGQVFVHQVTGGVSRYYANLVSGINAIPGCVARVVAPLHRNEHLRAAGGRQVYGFCTPDSLRTGRLCWLATRALSPALSTLLQSDIVHETYFCPKPYLTRARRRVTTMYDMIHEIYTPGHFTTEHKRASLARCEHVICISHNTRKDLCEMFDYPQDRTSVVHLGYQDFSMLGAVLPFPSAHQKAPYFLYVGQRSGYKNFAGMLRAFAASPSLVRDFRIVCFGGGLLTQEELALSSELGLDEHHLIQLSGSDEQLASAYQNAVALVYPSLYEGFGLPPLEAMSAGCPVLASATSSLPEVVGDAGITFDPTDSEAIRDSMLRITQSAERRTDIVRRGHERRQLFTWARCVEQTLDVYRRLN